MRTRDIPYYRDYVSDRLLGELLDRSQPIAGVAHLRELADTNNPATKDRGLETQESLQFLCELYDLIKVDLGKLLNQRVIDRKFLDQRTRACYELNQKLRVRFTDPDYETVLGHEDAQGRIVMGPLHPDYCRAGRGDPIAPLPAFLQGFHVTLFGPPDDAKLSINAMNSLHRKLKNEPGVVTDLVSHSCLVPKWGADDEDSKTPLRRDLQEAAVNLSACSDHELKYVDPVSKKTYSLEKERLALPIKRFPGLALPSLFLFFRENPLPLHLYDFALHLFYHWQNPQALCFYVPKLENEEEARYIRKMIEAAEKLLQKRYPDYQPGSIRLFIVLENPRAIFRTHEIIDELYPYFAGASLGWHDFLASTARLFKNDANYRIPVKADPDIVINYIKASHQLVTDVVGSRGGVKIGGMYGVLPIDSNTESPSFQITIKGYIKDVIAQLKRGLSGFWVAHPDFVRIGIALVEAWQRLKEKNDRQTLETLIKALLRPELHTEILLFIHGPDVPGLDRDNPLHARSLIVADLQESNYIANHDHEEVRYNVFQSLQYLADWLAGNGCVALPAQIAGVPVRVMDDLATAERSRWEVWHEVYHGRVKVEDFVRIVHQEYLFIRKDFSNAKKTVQVKWDARTEKWYPVALNLVLHLMSNKEPVEFATELLMPFTVESIRQADHPWQLMKQMDSDKYALNPLIERLSSFFSICGTMRFASAMANQFFEDPQVGQAIIRNLSLEEIQEAASYHGDIGENKKTLDEIASKEQALVLSQAESIKANLRDLGEKYRQNFGVKFLISAQGKSAEEILVALKQRLDNSLTQELENAREALWEISHKRMASLAVPAEKTNEQVGGTRLSQTNKGVSTNLKEILHQVCHRHSVVGAQIAVTQGGHRTDGLVVTSQMPSETLCMENRAKSPMLPVTNQTLFEIASLSKTIASCFALEYFKKAKIPIDTSVNSLLAQTKSSFRLKSLDVANPQWAAEVTLEHLMNHTALNMHYVNGIPLTRQMPNSAELLDGHLAYGYQPVGVIHRPGSTFQYSGGGFLLLEHLLECREQKSIQEITASFVQSCGLKDFTFQQSRERDNETREFAHGYTAEGVEIEGTRLMFPAFAAGAMSTATDVSRFLILLTKAYHSVDGAGPISHDTAVRMLHGVDLGSGNFMGAKMGLGVFTLEAEANRFALHQGANNGFRCLFLHCYDGPDRDFGFTILCNSDTNGVLFVAEAARLILSKAKPSGINLDHFQFPASLQKTTQTPPEQAVNRSYKDLIFSAFEADLPEQITAKGPVDPLSAFNLAVDTKILDVTNQKFARAENLLSPYLPVFDPELYGRQGKIMDSWESVRHNPLPCDQLILKLKSPAAIRYVSLSTKFHLGNQPQAVQIEGRFDESSEWISLVPKTDLQGHALKRVLSVQPDTVINLVRVSMFPDGGLTRLGLYSDNLPEAEKVHFLRLEDAVSQTFAEPIPHAARPLTPRFKAADSPTAIQKNLDRVNHNDEVDIASAALGGKILSASNEHYGPAAQIISPYPPLDMFDGFESARSRAKDHFEEVVLFLGQSAPVHRIEIDFTFFKNNNPRELSIDGLNEHNQWVSVFQNASVKSYAGNILNVSLDRPVTLQQLKVKVFPDGGMNRIRVLTRKA